MIIIKIPVYNPMTFFTNVISFPVERFKQRILTFDSAFKALYRFALLFEFSNVFSKLFGMISRIESLVVVYIDLLYPAL